jgi:hypothetical protein
MKQLREPPSMQFHLPLLSLQSAQLPPEQQQALVQALAELLLQAAGASVPSVNEGEEHEPEAKR